MTRERLLDLSRKLSVLEAEARQVRNSGGIILGIASAQTAVAKQLDKLDQAEREGRGQ